MKVKIKSCTAGWWYKELIGQEVIVEEFLESRKNHKIPYYAKGIKVFAIEHAGRLHYINPSDCEYEKKNQEKEKEDFSDIPRIKPIHIDINKKK